MSRGQVAQRPPQPGRDYRTFPSYEANTARDWFRNHAVRAQPDNGVWWFASSPADDPADQSGRFDLPLPEGTCYLATSAEAAINELIGPDHLADDWLEAELLVDRVVSKVRLPRSVRAANVSVATAASKHLVSAELTTMSDYEVTQAWARILRATGFGAIRYLLRFTPGGQHHGLALFGTAGPPVARWKGDPSPVAARAIVESMGIEVVDTPSFGAVTVVTP